MGKEITKYTKYFLIESAAHLYNAGLISETEYAKIINKIYDSIK